MINCDNLILHNKEKVIILGLPVNWQIIFDMVGDIDLYSISFSNINGWPREPPIYCYNWFCMA